MPQVNLSALNGQELRQLLDSSRRRGDAALSYKVLQEMEARRLPPAERRSLRQRHASEPHPVDADIGDPMEDPLEADDDLPPPIPNWRPPAHEGEHLAVPPPHHEPPPSGALDDDRPLSLHDGREWREDDADAPPPPGDRFEPVELGGPRAPPPRRFRLLAGIVIGAILGVAVGWLGGWLARDAMTPLGAHPAAPVQTAALTPPPAPPPPPLAEPPGEPAAPIPTDAAAAQAPADPAAPPAPQPKASKPTPDAAPAPDGAALELPAPDADTAKPPAKAPRSLPDRSTPAVAAPAVTKGCATQATPADRAICGDPKLKRLQGELRQAYNEALDAHEDRALLRQRQLAWADARNTVTDPGRLARLYQERIRKLNAATAEARAAQQQ